MSTVGGSVTERVSEWVSTVGRLVTECVRE